MLPHRGKQHALPGGGDWFWECWCGERWLCPPFAEAFLWCPAALVGKETTVPSGVLSMSISQPSWAATTVYPHVVTARVGRVSTQFASTLTPERALLLAHAMQTAHEKDPHALRAAW